MAPQQPPQSNPGSESSTKLTIMSISDIRSFVTSELSRLKDEISDLYDKINALKDAQNSDKMALMAQLNAEFARINSRLNDFSLAMQNVSKDSEHTDENFATKLQLAMSNIDNKILQLRSDTQRLDHSAEIAGLNKRLDAMGLSFDAKFIELKTAIAKLAKKESDTQSKVVNLTWKVGLIIAVAVWLVNTVGGDFLKDALKNAVKPAPVYHTQSLQDTTKK